MLWKHDEADVLVVGAGPIGMMAALMLAERGIHVEIIDQEAGGGRHNYALVLPGAALELLDDIGLASVLLHRGAQVERLVLREGGTGRVDLPHDRPAKNFPFLLVLPRLVLEEVLEQRLRERKVPIHWNQRLDTIEENGEGVSVTVQTLSMDSAGYPIGGHIYVVDKVRRRHPRFVIGADGSNSVVRRRLDIERERTGPAQSVVAVELETPLRLGREAHVVVEGERTSVLWPLPGGRCRWTLEVGGDMLPPDAEPPLSRRDIEELVESRAPWFPGSGATVEWAALLQFAPARASRFGRGRIWLAGDAAHVNGAIGIPDLDAGLHEARDLASRLARILRREAGLELLEGYNDEGRAAPAASLLGYLGVRVGGAGLEAQAH